MTTKKKLFKYLISKLEEYSSNLTFCKKDKNRYEYFIGKYTNSINQIVEMALELSRIESISYDQYNELYHLGNDAMLFEQDISSERYKMNRQIEKVYGTKNYF
jgi:molybdopterin-guanine dinucleotide biosynthesis protein A